MGKLSLFTMLFLSLVSSLTVAEYMCGKQLDGRICEDYRCCSQFGYCGSTYAYCSPQENCQSNCVPFGQVFTNVTAYYSYLNQDNYTLTGVDDCSPWYSNKSFEWRSRYEWTGFNESWVGLPLRAACGKCLKVTNLANGVHTKVRIVAAAGGLVLDVKPFSEIGDLSLGHLTVSYEFVLCGDEDEPELISKAV